MTSRSIVPIVISAAARTHCCKSSRRGRVFRSRPCSRESRRTPANPPRSSSHRVCPYCSSSAASKWSPAARRRPYETGHKVGPLRNRLLVDDNALPEGSDAEILELHEVQRFAFALTGADHQVERRPDYHADE